MAYIQRTDPAWNVFPSLHVAHATALALVIRAERPRVGAASLGLAMLLAASTLTTKQHFIADVIAGFAMAAVCSAIILRPFSHSPHASRFDLEPAIAENPAEAPWQPAQDLDPIRPSRPPPP